MAGLLGELGYPASDAEVRDRLLGTDARDLVFVADDEGVVIGLCAVHIGPQFHRARPVARIVSLVVADAHRGRNWGLRLVQHAVESARERGCGLVELTSRKERTDAHGFCETAGFARTGLRFSREL